MLLLDNQPLADLVEEIQVVGDYSSILLFTSGVSAPGGEIEIRCANVKDINFSVLSKDDAGLDLKEPIPAGDESFDFPIGPCYYRYYWVKLTTNGATGTAHLSAR